MRGVTSNDRQTDILRSVRATANIKYVSSNTQRMLSPSPLCLTHLMLLLSSLHGGMFASSALPLFLLIRRRRVLAQRCLLKPYVSDKAMKRKEEGKREYGGGAAARRHPATSRVSRAGVSSQARGMIFEISYYQ